jgi:hypothetical protein
VELLPGQEHQAVAGRISRDLAPADKKPATRPRSTATKKKRTTSRCIADKIEAESKATWDKSEDEQMHQHHRWAQATTVLQVAIALAAIALLTRKKWLEYGMFAVAASGWWWARGRAAYLIA